MTARPGSGSTTSAPATAVPLAEVDHALAPIAPNAVAVESRAALATRRAGAIARAVLDASQSGARRTADPTRPDLSLYTITLYIALVIFVGVEGALVYALVRFRARKGAVAAQIHGNTRLEIGWTVGAAVILVALAVLTFAELYSIRNPPNSGPEGASLASDAESCASHRAAACRPTASP